MLKIYGNKFYLTLKRKKILFNLYESKSTLYLLYREKEIFFSYAKKLLILLNDLHTNTDTIHLLRKIPPILFPLSP